MNTPHSRYRITFLPVNHTIEVNPDDIPFSNHGLPGSILDVALRHGIEIEHACGGFCACSTCHVLVIEGLESCNEPSELEQDKLDNACGVKLQSRLACQCVPDGTADMVVEIPEWNRNITGDK